MKRTIELDAESERLLYDWVHVLGTRSEEETLAYITKFVLLHLKATPESEPPDVVIRDRDQVLLLQFKSAGGLQSVGSAPGIMGGDACIRNTRIPVWSLVDYKRQGLSDSELLAAFPGLNAADLVAAWDYYAGHTGEVDAQRRRHEEAA